MNVSTLFRCGISALAMAVLVGASAVGQTVATVPVGAVTVTANAGTGTIPAVTLISIPLSAKPLAGGQVSGQITAFTTNTLSNSNAGWTSGALSTAATPYLVQITSGSAKGYVLLISTAVANTASTVTIDSDDSSLVDLTQIGLSLGDSYRLLPCDTLSSVFGTPAITGVQGAGVYTAADVIQVFIQGAYRKYYYNTTSSAWLRVGPNTNSDNVPIRPDSLIIYSRIASTPLSLVVTGDVPDVQRSSVIRKSGITPISTLWPVDTTLAALGLNTMSGWVSSSSAASSDTVLVQVQNAYRQYYFNGVNWIRVGPGTISDSLVIPAGTGVIITKLNTSTGYSALSQSLPYSL